MTDRYGVLRIDPGDVPKSAGTAKTVRVMYQWGASRALAGIFSALATDRITSIDIEVGTLGASILLICVLLILTNSDN